MKQPLRGLYAITPGHSDADELRARSEAALRGGARLLQYRDKTRPPGEKLALAQELARLCRRYRSTFIVNDDLELALAVDADGVHLGGSDGDLAAARRRLGSGRILGASCYADFALAERAAAAGADYVAFGAVHASPTKPQAVRADWSLFGRCRRELALPVCAIGGIRCDNAADLVAAGADMLAVISDLFEAPDIEARARAYQTFFAGETP